VTWTKKEGGQGGGGEWGVDNERGVEGGAREEPQGGGGDRGRGGRGGGKMLVGGTSASGTRAEMANLTSCLPNPPIWKKGGANLCQLYSITVTTTRCRRIFRNLRDYNRI